MRILNEGQVAIIAHFLALQADIGKAPKTMYQYADTLWRCVSEMLEIQERVHANIQAAFQDIADIEGQERYKEMEQKLLQLLGTWGIAVDSLQEFSGIKSGGVEDELGR